jgi:hypothetical protein
MVFFTANSSFASVGSVPYVTNIKTGYDPAGDAAFPFTAEVQWSMLTGIGNLDTALGKNGYISFILCGSFAASYGSVCVVMRDHQIPVTASMTWRDASDLIIKDGGSQGISTKRGEGSYYSPDFCAGVGLTDEQNYIHSTPVWFPGTTCTLAPPEAYSCTQTISPSSIDFGTLSSKAINGATASVNLTTSCNAQGSVTITPAWGTGGVPFNNATSGQGDISANVKFDNSPLNNSITYKAAQGTVNHQLNFTLSNNGNNGKLDYGKYEATAVFVFSYL